MAVVLLNVAVLSGCATHSAGFAKVEQEVSTRNVTGAMAALDTLQLTGTDQMLHHLNKAVLLRLQGEFAASNRELDVAKRMMESLEAISMAEQLGSVTVNDTLKAYEGIDYEQLLIYAFKSLNYLQLDDVSAAAVEARQFDIGLRLLQEKNPDAKYLDGAFVRYLNGMIYEAVGERDSARIEYTKALQAYAAQGTIPAPNALKADLARIEKSAAKKSDKTKTGEVVFFLHNGLGPSLSEKFIDIPNINPAVALPILRLALPKHMSRAVPVARVELSNNTLKASSERVEDVNLLAQNSMNARLPAIQTRALARLIVREIAKKTAKEQSDQASAQLGPLGSLLGLALDVGSIVAERADTRTWSLLPGDIHLARLQLPEGAHEVKAEFFNATNKLLDTRSYKVTVKNGKKVFIADYFIGQAVNY